MLNRSNQAPLHRYPLIDTRNPDEFRETLVSNFGALGFDLRADPLGFQVTRSYLRLKSVDLVFGACSSPYQVRFPAVPLLKQHFALHEAGRTTFGGTQFEISPHEAAVIPAGVEMTHEYQAGFEQFIFRVEALALQAKLSAVVGMPIARNIEFARRSNFDNPALRRLRRMLEFMVSELD